VANVILLTVAILLVAALLVVVGLSYRGAAYYIHPTRSVVAHTPSDVGVAFESLWLVAEDGLRIAAWYVPPTGPAPAPGLVLVHGITANRSDLLGITHDLAARGYALLLPDLRAHGESEGKVSTLGLNEVRDLRAAVKELASRPEVDVERLGILGYSLGAATAIMATAQIPEVKAVVADSGFASVEWLIRNQFQAFFRLPTWLAPLMLRLGSWQAGVDASLVAPVRHIASIHPRPVLLIHGDQDRLFRVDNLHLLAEAAGPGTDTWVVVGAGHVGAYGADPLAYAERVDSFFRAAFNPAAPLAAMLPLDVQPKRDA
jgi:dienelactone hydrolase